MGSYEFRGFVVPEFAVRCMAVYIWTSQVYCYRLVWYIAHARSLRQAQASNLLTDVLCVPADGMVVFFNPTGNKLATVCSFAIATTFFGTMMVYKGEGDGMISGAVHSTAETIRPALQIIKTYCRNTMEEVGLPW